MQLEYAKNPVWANADQTAIDLTVRFAEIPEDLPFTASPTDAEPHGRTLFAAAVAGEFGPIAPYVAPPVLTLTPEQIAALRRAAYQAESDPIFFKWQRGEATQQEWLDKIEEIRIRYPEPDQ